jgi:hypothetical protein
MTKLRRLVASIGIIFGFTSAMAADLPKEGTFKGTYTGFGTYKTFMIGDRALHVFDENGTQETDGFADHMTFHCWGTSIVENGEAAADGYCIGIDPARNLLQVKFAQDKHKVGDTAVKGSVSLIAGTGKFTGVIGTVATIHHAGEFLPLEEGTYVSHVTLEGNYKFP